MGSIFKSRLMVKVVSIVIVQCFLVSNVSFAAAGKFTTTACEKDTLSPSLQIGSANFGMTAWETLYKKIGLAKYSSATEMMLVENLQKLSRVKDGIVVGRGLADIHGRVFKPDSRFFTPEGEFTPKVQEFMDRLSEPSVQGEIHRGIMYYDSRSEFWRNNPEYIVAYALAYAKKIQEKRSKKDGIILNIPVDAYQKHFEAAQIFADVILRTGICDNGGGINYFGVLNGGDVRNYSQLYHALNDGEGGEWVFFTMSHRPEDYLGAKMGINAEVFCGSELRHCEGVTSGTLYDYIIKKRFAEIEHKKTPSDEKIVTVASFLKNNIAVAADMLRATSAPEGMPTDLLLQGLKIGVDMGGNPISKNLVDMSKALGADVLVDNEEIDPSLDTSMIIDPNEHDSPAVKRIRKRAEETDRDVWLALDPDGDRILIVAKDGTGKAFSLRGTKSLLLAEESLAVSFKKKGKKAPVIICDMRGSLSVKDLEDELNRHDIPLRVIPYEAGYPFFMRGMSSENADLAVEDTLHAFMNPMTNPNWGAPARHNFPGYQGGDNGALYAIYLLGCMKHQWQGRSPIEQLAWINETYNLKETVGAEKKPALDKEDDEFKYMIAERMKKIAAEYFTDPDKFFINYNDPSVTVMSGVHMTNAKTRAMMLDRHSNTGPGFTISGEAYTGILTKEDLIKQFGYSESQSEKLLSNLVENKYIREKT